MDPVGVRGSFERMGPAAPGSCPPAALRPSWGLESQVVARFGAEHQAPEIVYAVVKDLPIYRDRRFNVSQRMDEFLNALPFMTKSDLRRHFPQGFLRTSDSFAALVASKTVEVVRTSGTSSERLQILWETDWWERQELAALCTNPVIQPHMNDAYREAVLTTPLCSESVCKTGPATMEERRIDNLLFLNTQHDPSRWGRADLNRMADELHAFQPVAIEADPVYLAALARYIREYGCSIPSVRWVILTYELVSSIDKALIQSHFNCPVFEFYGLTEAGVFFLECPQGRHHFCGTDSVVEVLRPPDSRLPAHMGELLVTTWGNRMAPLLRYRTGDLAAVDPAPCACGKPGPTVSSFEGRIRDLLERPDGLVLTPRQVDTALFGTERLVQYQCVQEKTESVRIDYVVPRSTGEGEGESGGEEIRSRLRFLLGSRTEVRASMVPFVAPEPSGKYRTVVPFT